MRHTKSALAFAILVGTSSPSGAATDDSKVIACSKKDTAAACELAIKYYATQGHNKSLDREDRCNNNFDFATALYLHSGKVNSREEGAMAANVLESASNVCPQPWRSKMRKMRDIIDETFDDATK
jgi:hypothetical protein